MRKGDKAYFLVLTLTSLLFFLIIFSFTDSISKAQTDSSTEYVYVPNTKTNEVYVINATTNNIIATLPVGKIPNGVAVNRDGSKIYVTNTGDDEVPGRRFSIIYTDTYEVMPRLVGEGRGYKPLGIAISPDETLYIASSVITELAIYNVSSGLIAIPKGLYPRPSPTSLGITS